MHEAEKLSLEAIGRFVEASEEIRFESADRSEVYGWVERLLVGQEYGSQGKAARVLVRRYIEKMTGLSRAQVTRLIGRYTAKGQVQTTIYRRSSFPQRYTRADIELLASVDEAHETSMNPLGLYPAAIRYWIPRKSASRSASRLAFIEARKPANCTATPAGPLQCAAILQILRRRCILGSCLAALWAIS